jgi:hypothetical protein
MDDRSHIHVRLLVESERDRLKAELDKARENERAWAELAQERGKKLAALVKARYTERASEIRAMRSWVEYQPCLRDGVASETLKSYLDRQVRVLDDLAAKAAP